MTAGPDRRRLHAVVAAVSLAAPLAVLSAVLPPTAPPAAAAAVAAAAPPDPTVAAATGPQAETAADLVEDGLDVEISSLTPSALEPGEPVELGGTVTNTSDHLWRDAQAYLVISPSPLTTRVELEAAAASPAESYFGDRVTDFGFFNRMGPLSPGEVASVDLDVPWSKLAVSGAEGVYTVGIQVIATDVDGTRSTVGRARTFLPLVDAATTATVRLALVWPLRAPVLRRADGTYARRDRLVGALGTGGRLNRVVDLGLTSAAVPLTVVPDPAVLDAARDLGAGRYGPPGGLVTPAGVEPIQPPGTAPEVAAWLEDAVVLADRGTSWSTAYAEPAVDTLARSQRVRVGRSVQLATRAAQQHLLGGPAAVLTLPPRGWVDPDGLGWLAAGGAAGDGPVVAVLAPRMLPAWEPLDGSAQTVPTAAGPLPLVVADPALAAGGPLPGDPRDALQVRQRLLAETALLGKEGAAVGRSGLSATFLAPERWDPGGGWRSAAFFTGLDVDWLDTAPLEDLLSDPRVYDGPLGVGATGDGATVAALLAETAVESAAELDRKAGLLGELVGGPPLRRWYDFAVALGVSSSGLRDGYLRQQLTQRTATAVGRALRGVSVTGPGFVALSSSRGRFPLTVTNSLDRPVTVSVVVDVTGGAEVEARARFDPGNALTIGPGRSETVTVTTRVTGSGVRSATAYLATPDGHRFGRALDFSLRTSIVGTVIWVILGVACAVLLFAIARRLYRRIRGRSRSAATQRGTGGTTPVRTSGPTTDRAAGARR